LNPGTLIKGKNMILIGENLNVMVKKIGTAMKEKDPKPIQELAIAEVHAGVDYIDINLGPARKGGGELMEWVVKTVQEVVNTPLYLDTVNAEAIEAGLRVYKNKKGKADINSIMARPESMEVKFPLAQKYEAGIVALLWGPSGLPRDANERGILAAELMQKAMEFEDVQRPPGGCSWDESDLRTFECFQRSSESSQAHSQSDLSDHARTIRDVIGDHRCLRRGSQRTCKRKARRSKETDLSRDG
jgi:cobalamin-dependent methionine synthase I